MTLEPSFYAVTVKRASTGSTMTLRMPIYAIYKLPKGWEVVSVEPAAPAPEEADQYFEDPRR